MFVFATYDRAWLDCRVQLHYNVVYMYVNLFACIILIGRLLLALLDSHLFGYWAEGQLQPNISFLFSFSLQRTSPC